MPTSRVETAHPQKKSAPLTLQLNNATVKYYPVSITGYFFCENIGGKNGLRISRADTGAIRGRENTYATYAK
jgi:hypothetical protein